MSEKIIKIEEAIFSTGKYYSFEGFVVTTDKQQIKLGIDDSSQCCEDWGYFMTNDNLEEFIGSEVLSVDLVDDSLNKEKAPDIYEGGVMFVNIETSNGTLQFTAYNEHNGYYSHEAVVICQQLNTSEQL